MIRLLPPLAMAFPFYTLVYATASIAQDIGSAGRLRRPSQRLSKFYLPDRGLNGDAVRAQ